jgi:hypothetical protein
MDQQIKEGDLVRAQADGEPKILTIDVLSSGLEMATCLVNNICVDPVRHRDRRDSGARLRALLDHQRLQFGAVAAPGDLLGVCHGVHLTSGGHHRSGSGAFAQGCIGHTLTLGALGRAVQDSER